MNKPFEQSNALQVIPRSGEYSYSERQGSPSFEIGMGQFVVEKGNLITRGASTCIVIAAHNKISKKGMLTHLSSLTSTDASASEQRDVLEQALSAVTSWGDGEHTKIQVLGGSHLREGGKLLSSSKRNRDYVQNRLSQFRLVLPVENIRVDWLDDDRSIDVELNTKLGTLAVYESEAFKIPEETDPFARLAHLLK